MSNATAGILLTIEKISRMSLLLAAGQKVFKNTSAVGDTSTGTVKKAAPSTTLVGLGVFNQDLDNSAGGSSVPVDVNFLKEKTILYRVNDGTITAANLFSNCYYLDDQTVSATSAAHSVAGMILVVDAVKGVGFVVP